MKAILILIILVVFLWAGMLLGISFLEAPLKFKAPNVSLAIGLGIGRLVFSALNRIEIMFSIITLLLTFFIKPPTNIWTLISIINFVLMVETLWLLPELDQRAQIIISGGQAKPDSPHIYYVIGEVIKLCSLIALGCILLKDTVKNNSDFYTRN